MQVVVFLLQMRQPSDCLSFLTVPTSDLHARLQLNVERSPSVDRACSIRFLCLLAGADFEAENSRGREFTSQSEG